MNGPLLALVGTPIGNLSDVSERVIHILTTVDVIAAEDTRRTRAMRSALDIPAGQRLFALHKHTERTVSRALVERLRAGATVAYVTDAGMPTISDPGFELVRLATEADIPVTVIPGPDSITTALALSGFHVDRFVFEGFLPRKGADRKKRLAAIAVEASTVVIFESPHRVQRLLFDLGEAGLAQRSVAVAREMTKRFEEVLRGTVSDVAAHFDEHPPRGEFVVVLAAHIPEQREPSSEEIRRLMLTLLNSGLRSKEVAKELAATFGLSARDAYERVIEAQREQDQPR
ncbi:MAG: 16S rRNA (cytidine(1402)-2'-O)-methyltransferase [Acidimicrobiia bacterium]|nr:16S rRNA (cytidine(1402)-2'-O)-methyltransferase [Acidimicrobiia bacterium]